MTKEKLKEFLLTGISTHTLTWSVTLLFNFFVLIFIDFNSHAHVERDGQIYV